MKSKEIKILLAAPRGFCAGVDRAIEIVKKSIKKYYFFETMLSLVLLSCFLITGKEYAAFIFEIPSILAINYF